MQLILGVVTSSPYREAVLQFSEHLAWLLDGKVRLATLAARSGPGDEPPAGPDGEEAALVERAEEDAGREFTRADGRTMPHDEVWIGGDPVRETARELAHCDIGVVGKTLRHPPAPGATVATDVLQLKQSVTKPLVIVPDHVRRAKRALFVYTEHPESGHALTLAEPLSRKDVEIKIATLIPPIGRTELIGSGVGYLKAHEVPYEAVRAECEDCPAEGGPVAVVLHLVKQEKIDLIVMGGTRRGLVGRLLWPEMAREVVWNADVPVLIWY
jgi:nucleotide-binding universal stress UspA family protein